MARNRRHLSPHIETWLPPGEQRMKQLNNMASSECSVPKVDYKQLNGLSSVILFAICTKKFKGRKIYDVERIIERRKAKYVRCHNFWFFSESRTVETYQGLICAFKHYVSTRICFLC